MFVAAALARMLPCDGCRWRLWPALPAAAMLAAALVYGHWRTSGYETSPGPRIALIQGKIDVEMISDPDQASRERKFKEIKDRTYDQYYALSKRALDKDRKIDLVVWPEVDVSRTR